MIFRRKPLKLLSLLPQKRQSSPASVSVLAKMLDFKMVFATVMLVAACASCASDAGFSNTSPEIRPVMETPSTNLLVNAIVSTSLETNIVAIDAVKTDPVRTNGIKTDVVQPSVLTNSVADGSTNAMDDLDNDYRLAIGDMINFQVIEDEDDAQPIQVTDSGDIQVPYIGRYPAMGKTCRELAYELKTELQKKYYYHATVIISVKSMASKGVIYLMGEVRAPGPLELPRDDVLTISRAVLRAGGFGDFADEKHVQVTRKGPGGTNQVFIINVKAILDDNKVQEDRKAEPGDLIYVPAKTFRY